jgi:hypothetical protein
MALISRIQVAVPARKLKLGDRALTGHVSFFDRTANIEEVADVLPRLAADVKVMEFTAQVGRAANHTYKDFKVRRFKVERALRWLCANSPAYVGVTISAANLALLPTDGQLDVTVIQVPPDADEQEEDLGPAAAQRAPAGAPVATAPISVRQDGRQVGAEVFVLSEGQGAPRPGRITAIVPGPLVQLRFLDDDSIGDGIPLERVFIEVECDHTGVVDAGDAQPHAAARDAQDGLAGLAQTAQFPNAAAARAAAAAAPPAAAPPPPPRIVLHHVSQFLDWSATPFFFAKAFPTLFMPDRLGDPANATVPAEFHPVPTAGFFLWDKGAEGRWPGAFYVGASRAMAPHNLALRYTMAKDDLDAIVNGVAWKVQRIKVAQLLDRAREFRTELALRREQPWHMDGIGAHHWGSKYDFAKRFLGFITTHRLAIAQSQFLAQAARDEALRCLSQWEESILQLRLIP